MSISAGVLSSPHLWAASRAQNVRDNLVKYMAFNLTSEPDRWRKVASSGKMDTEDRARLQEILLEFGADPRPGVQQPPVISLPLTKRAAHGDVTALGSAFRWDDTEQRADFWDDVASSPVMREDVPPVLELWHERNQDLQRHAFWSQGKLFDAYAREEFLAGEFDETVLQHVEDHVGGERRGKFLERLDAGSGGVIRELLHAAGLHFAMSSRDLGLDGPNSVRVVEALREERYIEAGVLWADELNAEKESAVRGLQVLEDLNAARGKVRRALTRRVCDAHQASFIDYGSGKPPADLVRNSLMLGLSALKAGSFDQCREHMLVAASQRDGSCPRLASMYWGMTSNRPALLRRLEYLTAS